MKLEEWTWAVMVSNGLSMKTYICQYIICPQWQFQMGVEGWGVNLKVTIGTRQLPSGVKGLSYVEVLQGGQSSLHVQTTLLVFSFCEATGALECMFWEILQKLLELQSTANVAQDSIFCSGCHHEDGQLQNDDNSKLVGISRALGMKESHFLSKNVFWENAVGYLRNGEC